MNGPTKKIVYSWDANVFLAHFKQEENKREHLSAICAIYDEVERGSVELLVSVIVVAEMLDLINDPKMSDEFQRLLKRPNVRLMDVTPHIARKTAELRSKWRNESHRNEPRNIKTPDAIIIATAAHCGASVLHTFEDKYYKHSETPLVSNLKIIKPMLSSGQQVFPGLT
jgi:predicted nucleic acid-binding protein